ncbi:hypothetical protein F4802DRAFT_584711 [Xylaria palmicola]|nr:hypothetical protein F4802DRAFT_584711 [Xylaria palmicola]
MFPLKNNPPQEKEEPAYPAQLPPAFWDSLSAIPLTKNALRELERRNTKNSLHTQSFCSSLLRQPITQHSASQYLNYCSPIERERIKRFARIGGPDLSDLRGCCYAPSIGLGLGMSDRQSHLGRRKRGSASALESNPMLPTTSTRSTGPYDRAFQQLLIDYGVYPNRYEHADGEALPPPENLEEIRQAMVKPRPSLSLSRFSREDFEQFERADAHALKEAQVMSTVIPIIEGVVRDGSWVAGQVPFTNLEDPTGGLLVPGNPDRYYGALPAQLDRQVRTQLGKHIVPSTQHNLPVAPNFFLNTKGPDGSLAVAKNQACYEGALGARGMNSLQTYGDPELDSDNKAYTLTSIYHGGTLTIYASYLLPQAGGLGMRREYAMTQVNAYALAGNIENFRIGVSAYRNARDWAKQKRDEAIKRANETAARDQRDTLPSSREDVDVPPAKRARGACRVTI